ncbi:unnamed protein product [Cuscuta campestris]|uniref:Uncharacterized protein n=1 Tax=Cuscuta campestris TaxID=132261 RepID=A0A484M726_9ASTE|nr:unnamed protein product [Cuscuta campestris]
MAISIRRILFILQRPRRVTPSLTHDFSSSVMFSLESLAASFMAASTQLIGGNLTLNLFFIPSSNSYSFFPV